MSDCCLLTYFAIDHWFTGRTFQIKMPPKAKHPCIVCKDNVTSGSLACSVCKRWVHTKCAGLKESVLDFFIEQVREHGHHFWSCEGCAKGGYQLSLKIHRVEEELKSVKKSVEVNTKDIGVVNDRMEKLETNVTSEIGRLKQDKDEMVKAATKAWSAELRARAAKANNLVLHNLAEPPPSLKNPRERKGRDEAALSNLLASIGVSITEEDIKFTARPGVMTDNIVNKPRPLIVGFKEHGVKEDVLNKARNLRHSTHFSRISIVPDLTAQQRTEDKEILDEAARKNEEMDEAEASNFEWRCVGRKGERTLVKVKRPEANRGVATGGNKEPLGQERVQLSPLEPVVPQPMGASETPASQEPSVNDDTESEEELLSAAEEEEEAAVEEETQAAGRKRARESPPPVANEKTGKQKKTRMIK